MRIEQLRYFLSLAKTQSLNKTGLEFYTTHQGISKAIRQLEDEIGAPLFTRSSKGMFLTNEGHMFLPVAEKCVRDLHDIQLKIRYANRQQDLEGILQIWGTPLTNATLMPGLFEDFSTLYPKIRYQVDEADTLDILRSVSLHRNLLGSALVLHDPRYHTFYEPYLHEVICYPLQQDEYVCLAHKSLPLAERKQIRFEEFAAYPVTTLIPDTNNADHPIKRLLRELGHTELSLSTQTSRLIAQAITSGKYVALGSRRGLDESAYLDDDIVAIPFEEDLSLDIMLVTNTHPQLNEISQAFVELARENAPETIS